MRTPTEFELQRLLKHAYDPVKAHEYYLRTRKLKGRKKGSSKTANSKLVKGLAYVQEGGDRKVAAQLVKWAQGKSDDEIKKKITEIKKKYGNRDATMSFTLGQILQNRERIRAGKASVKRKPGPIASTKTAQRKVLKAQIQNMENKLAKLEDLIRKKARDEASDDRKSKAKKERAAKEADKPKTAAEKAEIARENKKYREKNQQKLKTAAKKDSSKSSDNSSSKTKSAGADASVSDLKTLASKVRGQIAVAKQKLAAL